MVRLLLQALRLAADAHEDQVDKCGQPFLGHPARVAAYVAQAFAADEATIAAALLHDAVEDADVSLERIEAACGATVRDLVDALTRRDGESYRGYIERIAGSDRRAIAIKLADLRDNMDDRRATPGFRAEFEGMLASRYAPAVARLEEMLGRAERWGLVVGQRVKVKDSAKDSVYAGNSGIVIGVGVDVPGSKGYDYRVAFGPRDERGVGFMEYELESDDAAL